MQKYSLCGVIERTDERKKLERLMETFPSEKLTFWATHSGAEVDLFWQHAGKNHAIEVKYADAPRLSPSMKSALVDLELDHLWVLYPGDRQYPLAKDVTVLPLADLGHTWPYS